ncbi:MAG: hypothetical protein WA884_07095, partial [Methyloceanibacter sp.]
CTSFGSAASGACSKRDLRRTKATAAKISIARILLNIMARVNPLTGFTWQYVEINLQLTSHFCQVIFFITLVLIGWTATYNG